MTEIQITDRLIHLRNDRISYIMGIMEPGILTHLYFGKRLESFRPESILRRYGLKDEELRLKKGILNNVPLEYPSWGLGDMREGSLIARAADGGASCDLRFRDAEAADGKYRLDGLPSAYGENAKTLRVRLYDEKLRMRVTLLYAVFEDCDVITRSAVIENQGSEAIELERAASLCLELPDDRYDLITLSGAWARERAVYRRRICPGEMSVSSLRGASSHITSPFAALARPETSESQGEVYGAALVYSGSFYMGAQVDSNGAVRLQGGLNDRHFSWKLDAGETFTVPEGVLVYSDCGLDGMSAQFHTLCANHIVRGKWAKAPRPILLNNWEATYFAFDEEKLLSIAKKAAETGIELFVLDDGWFGHRDDDHSSLGDWFVYEKKLPDGIRHLSDRIHEMGLKFGLWFEPEMISPDSDLFRKHPDWAMQFQGREHVEGRNQLILDLSNPEVCEHVYQMMAGHLREDGIDYIKWDMNRNFTNPGSMRLPPDRMKEFPHRYMLGLYSILSRLTEAFPEVLFESCSGGGGRFDLGMLSFMPQTWCSDNTDAISRCRIQWGTSYVFPPFSMGAHVSAVPNHQTGRITPINTRINVAMSGCFGFELDLNRLTEEEIAQVRAAVVRIKEVREILLYGEFHRLSSPYEGHDTAWITVSKDHKRAILMLTRDLAQPNANAPMIRLRGLDAQKTYRVLETGEVYRGDELMNSGITPELPKGDAASVSLTLAAEE